MSNNRHLNRERETVYKMISLYCRAHHHSKGNKLCSSCQSLVEYAFERIERCPFGATKPTCANCKVHCYRGDRRDEIREVMRYSGPRMLLHHPYLAIMHLVDRLREAPPR